MPGMVVAGPGPSVGFPAVAIRAVPSRGCATRRCGTRPRLAVDCRAPEPWMTRQGRSHYAPAASYCRSIYPMPPISVGTWMNVTVSAARPRRIAGASSSALSM